MRRLETMIEESMAGQKHRSREKGCILKVTIGREKMCTVHNVACEKGRYKECPKNRSKTSVNSW